MLSIIIPTLNEEDYLPRLLRSIKKQGFTDYEVIVADAGSSDETLNIARSYGCKIVKGGLPAKGRNEGAKVAKGEILFFLDADAILLDDFLSESLREFSDRKLDIAGFCLKSYPANKFFSFFENSIYNKIIIISEKVLPHSAVGILMKKELFNKLGGYDETIKLAEDMDLSRRAVKMDANFGIIRTKEILASDRRFKKDGLIAIGIKFFLCELHMIFIGPVRSNIFNYKFNHYKEENSKIKHQT